MSGLQGVGPTAAWFRARVNTLWVNGANPRTTIAWDNTSFTPPNPPDPWIRPSIIETGGEQATFGTGATAMQYRFDGMVTIEVFTPATEGDGENQTLCDHAATMFRGVSASGLRFLAPPFVVRVGIVDDVWFKQDVMCPFIRDTIYT